MKKVAVSQSNYIPWKGYFDSINVVDEFVLYDDMQYTKRDWRNRNKIKTQNGLQWLSIPVEVKGKFYQKINETRISDGKWRQDHWNTIFHNYRKAAYFNEYKEILETLYLSGNENYLSEVNYKFLKTFCEVLEIKTTIRWSSEFDLSEGKTERLVEICKKMGATQYYSGPSAKSYLDESLFEKEGIKVGYFDFSDYPEYRQLHGSFDHEVSVVDLLLNEGPNSKRFMKSFKSPVPSF